MIKAMNVLTSCWRKQSGVSHMDFCKPCLDLRFLHRVLENSRHWIRNVCHWIQNVCKICGRVVVICCDCWCYDFNLCRSIFHWGRGFESCMHLTICIRLSQMHKCLSFSAYLHTQVKWHTQYTDTNARSWTLSSFFKFVLYQNSQTTGQYLKFALTKDMNIHLMFFHFKTFVMRI